MVQTRRLSMLQRLIGSPYLVLALAFASAALLAAAYGFQYWAGLWPCELCLKQRPPHWAAVGLGLFAFLMLKHGQARIAAFLLALMGLILWTGAGIAGFHVGVEWGWWPGPSSCAAGLLQTDNPAAMAEALMNAPLVSCEQVMWSLFGISMAGYNLLFSALLGAAALAAAWHWRRKEQHIHDNDPAQP